MSDAASLVRRFAAADLALQVAPVPLSSDASTRDIVQLDIVRTRERHAREEFRLWAGSASNRVEVCTADRKMKQLVLLVHEPPRRFVTRVSKRENVRGARVVREGPFWLDVELTTPEQKRHFLCGRDESHLFIARLPHSAPTIRAAHDALRPVGVRHAEQVESAKSIRQGEWFFVELSPSEARDVESEATRFDAHRLQRVSLAIASAASRPGRAHVADDVLVVFERNSNGRRVFARGAVRHPDHKTIELRSWRAVFLNSEVSAQLPGMRWVD